ncbi:hypothetical protein DIPPA_50029 [Diplonema papillatum]|nr:hypothetical protein DIPPA_50029 [Diplonema papillatum]
MGCRFSSAQLFQVSAAPGQASVKRLRQSDRGSSLDVYSNTRWSPGLRPGCTPVWCRRPIQNDGPDCDLSLASQLPHDEGPRNTRLALGRCFSVCRWSHPPIPKRQKSSEIFLAPIVPKPDPTTRQSPASEAGVKGGVPEARHMK